MTTQQTRGQKVAADIAALLRARNPLLWIVTQEEQRAERFIFEACARAGYPAKFWDCVQGVTALNGDVEDSDLSDAGDFMKSILRGLQRGGQAKRCVWVMRDLPVWLAGPMMANNLRTLRNLARVLPEVERDRAQSIIVLTPSKDVPPELANHASVINWPLPDREEIEGLLDACIASLPDDLKESAAPNGQRDAAIDAAIGLSAEETKACFARSLVQTKRIEPSLIANEKKRVIAKNGMLQWFDPLPDGLASVGGLDALKVWIKQRATAYTKEAKDYGLPAPKGMLLVGVPGCGKSLTAKAVATAYQMPLLRLDMGALKSKFVGESEANLRKALEVIETVNRCVVWIDEIEKAMAGATQGGGDGGVSQDTLGTILSWMQDRKSEAFVIATANDISSLPPELLRKGRFDEVWFVDLPNPQERAEILLATLKSFKQEIPNFDRAIADVVKACDKFTGSEIAAIVPDAMFVAFSDNQRKLSAGDLSFAAKSVVPLAEQAKEKINKLRDWAKTRARFATTPTNTSNASTGARQIDLG